MKRNGFKKYYAPLLVVFLLSLSVKIYGAAPQAPTLTLAGTTQTQINLTWNAVSGATQYNVYQDGSVIPVSIYTNSYSVGVSCGTTHSYYVKAGNSAGEWSGASNTVNGTALPCTPAAPTGLTVTGTAQTNINLSWNAVSGATQYNVYQDGSVIPVTIYTNSYSVGVSCGTTHSYYVKAGNAGGWSGASNTVSGTAVVCTPAAPTGLTVTGTTQTNINLSWNAVSGATGYVVYEDGMSIPLTISGNSYSVPVSCGTTHSYYVIAGNAGGWSGASNTVSGTAVVCTPAAPTGLTVTGTTQTNISLSWNAVSGATQYNVYQDGTVIPVTIYTNSYSVGASCGTTHSYYVKAGNAGGWSGASNTVSGTAVICTPAAPTGLTVTGTSQTNISLSWNAVSGATQYNVYQDGTAIPVTIYTNSYSVGVSCGTTHSYYVIAGNAGGWSGASNTVSGTALPCTIAAPTGLTVTGTTQTNINLSWNAVSGATRYNVYQDGTVIPVTIYTNSYSVGVSCGITHSYYIKAGNDAGTWSGASNTVNGTAVVCTPAAPNGLTVTGTTQTTINLSWNTVSGATEYVVYEDGMSIPLTISGNSYSVPVSCGTTHSYYVKAGNAGGWSGASNTVNGTALACTIAAPTGLTVTGTTQTNISLSWNAVSGADRYILYQDGTSIPLYIYTNSYTVDVPCGTTHSYYVTAGNAGGWSGASNTVNGTTLACTIAAPTGLTVTGTTQTNVNLTWNTVTGATGYVVYEDGMSIPVTISGNSYSVPVSCGTTHSYYVKAKNDAGVWSGASNTVTGTAIPCNPANLKVASTTQANINLTWDLVSGATGYIVYEDGMSIPLTISGNSYSVPVSCGTTHSYYVIAGNAGGWSGASNTISGTALPCTIAAPTGLTVTGTTQTNIDLSWNAVSGATQYNVYQDGTVIPVSIYTNSYSVGVSCGTTHSYYVKAGNAGVWSDASNTVNGTALPCTPAVPTGLNVTGTTQTNISLSWNAVSGADRYILYQDGTSIPLYIYTNSYTVDVPCGTTHSYYVTAGNAGGWSGASNTVNGTTLACTIAAPTGLTVTGTTQTNINLSWNAVSGATVYNVYQDGTVIPVTINTNSFSVGVLCGTNHSYYVIAGNDAGVWSGPSSTVNGTAVVCTPAAPTGLTVTGTTQTNINLSWNAVSGATGYIIYEDGMSIPLTISGNSYSVPVSCGTTHSYYVTAGNAGGWSGASNTVNGTALACTIAAPTGLAVTGTTQTTINLSWNTVSGATRYNVYQDGTVIPVTINTNSFSVGVLCGTTHSYYVIAGNDAGTWSGASNTVSETALACTLTAPTGLKVTGTTQTNINLTWNTVTAATQYNVYQDGTVIPVSIYTNSFSVGVLCGTTHSYYVIAGDDYGNWSGPSNNVNGTALTCTTVTITTKSNPLKGGTTSGGGKYMPGTSVTVKATPATGYDFINWTENGSTVSTNSTYTFTVIGYRTLTANYSLQLKRYYYVKDHLGSIRVTVDVAGALKSYDDYDSWGMQLAGRSLVSGTNGKYKFTGKERDAETGFDYFGARYYDSRIGRWMAVDPLADKYPGWSPYNYTLDNPIRFIDPDGKDILGSIANWIVENTQSFKEGFNNLFRIDANAPKLTSKSEEQVEKERASDPSGLSKQEIATFQFAVVEDFVVNLANAEARAISTTLSLASCGATSEPLYVNALLDIKSYGFNLAVDLTGSVANRKTDITISNATALFGVLSITPGIVGKTFTGAGLAESIFAPNTFQKPERLPYKIK